MERVPPICAVDARMINHSGIGVYFRNIFREMVERGDLRFQVLARRQDFDALAFGEGLEFTEVTSPIYSIAEQLELPRKLSARSRCLWTPHYNMPLLTGCSRLVTVHDVAHLAEPTLNQKVLPRLYARTIMSAVKTMADHIFFVSQFTETEFSRVVGRPRGKVSITRNAAADLWHCEPTATAIPSPREPSRPYLIFVGNVKPHKNIGGLLKALELLDAADRPDLLIVGRRDGFFQADETVGRLAARLGGHVTFTGEVSDSDLVRHVRGAEALIQPSFYEGFGIPPLEAMAVGTPVLVSDIPPLRETCGDAALYFDPRDSHSIAGAIQRILGDASLRAKLRSAGRLRCAEFSFRKSAEIVQAAIMQQIEDR